jgi:hypothetical protein
MGEEKVVGLSEELKQALQACEPIEVEGTFLYVPLPYRTAYPEDKERWPVFKLRYLDGLQVVGSQDKLFARVAGTAELAVTRGAHIIHICYELEGIAGWKNYTIDYKDRESIRRLPQALLSELCNAITGRTLLTEEEVRGLK